MIWNALSTELDMPSSSAYQLGSIKLVPVDDKNFVMIILTTSGVVKSTQISVEKPFDYSVLDKLSNWINNKFSGMSVNEITQEKLSEERDIIPVENYLIEPIFSYLITVVNELTDVDIQMAGTTNIFNHPEFNNIDKAKDFLTFMKKDNSDSLKQLMSTECDNISVVIGEENPVLKNHDLSMVVSNYSLGDGLTGKLAIIGPRRMDYAKAISTLNYLIGVLGTNGEKLISAESDINIKE